MLKKTIAASIAHEAGVLESFGSASFVNNVTHQTGLSHGSCNVYNEGIAYYLWPQSYKDRRWYWGITKSMDHLLKYVNQAR